MDESQEFRLDSIKLSIDELSETKSNLEKEVEECYRRRKQLEEEVAKSMFGNGRMKLSSVSDKNLKMQETLKVAKFKAEQMDKMGEILDKRNVQLQGKIEELESKIKEQQQKQAENLYKFGDQLDTLSKNFTNAVTYYTGASLQDLIMDAEKKAEQLLIKVNETEKAITESNNELQQLTTDALIDTEGLPFEQRKTAWKQFQDELDRSVSDLQTIEEEKSIAENELMN